MNQESITRIRHRTGVNALEACQLNATQEVLHSSVGWKSHGHNFVGLQRCAAGGLPSHKTTMTGPYYSELLKKNRQAFTENWRGMLTRCPLLLHDNAPAHISQVAQVI